MPVFCKTFFATSDFIVLVMFGLAIPVASDSCEFAIQSSFLLQPYVFLQTVITIHLSYSKSLHLQKASSSSFAMGVYPFSFCGDMN